MRIPLPSRRQTRIRSGVLAALVSSFFAPQAFALQSLDTFVAGAKSQAPKLKEAQAIVEQKRAEEQSASYRRLPTLSLTGSYTRNQYEREFMFPGSTEPQPFMPHNQFDAAITLKVPILELPTWKQHTLNQNWTSLSKAQQKALEHQIELEVVGAYYQLLAATALRSSAERNLDISKGNARIVAERRAAGTATELDRQRANAEVAQAEQNVINTQLGEELHARTLVSLTGITPEPVEEYPEDNLTPPPELGRVQKSAENSPTLAVLEAATKASRAQGNAARSLWYPTVHAVAQERFTNATALVGHSAYYMLQLQVGFHFDAARLHVHKASRAATRASEARKDEGKRALDDALYATHHKVKAGIKRARAARKQDQAAQQALALAQAQYEAGATTQMEVLAVKRAAFAAEVARIQADTELAYSRATLSVLASPAGPASTTFSSSDQIHP